MRLTTMTALACSIAGVSAFAPPALAAHSAQPACAMAQQQRAAGVVMGRKGRPAGMPAGMQGAYAQAGQQQTPQVPTDGTPVFYLYCRTGRGKPWYPVSAMKGDGQSKGLIGAWLNSPVAKGVFKDRLDEGMAKSIFDSERRLASMAVEQYRQLKDYQSRLQWGFKIMSQELEAKVAEVRAACGTRHPAARWLTHARLTLHARRLVAARARSRSRRSSSSTRR